MALNWGYIQTQGGLVMGQNQITGRFTMSNKELDRHTVMQELLKKSMRQRNAATTWQLSIRHIKRLFRAYKQDGIAGIISKRPGRTGRKPYNKTLQNKVIDIIPPMSA